MKINIKKLREDAILPTYGTEYSAGMDLYSLNDEVIVEGETKLIHTGIAVEIPEGYVGLVFARSGLATKKGLAPANKVGVIDSDYRGEIMVALHNHNHSTEDASLWIRFKNLDECERLRETVRNILNQPSPLGDDNHTSYLERQIMFYAQEEKLRQKQRSETDVRKDVFYINKDTISAIINLVGPDNLKEQNGKDAPFIDKGERIAQMVIVPYIHAELNEVDELSDTVRGDGGFGSTGSK